MLKPRMHLSACVGKLLKEQDGDAPREGTRVFSEVLMESQVAGLIGAERHERTGERTASRNRSRTRTWDTRMGTPERHDVATLPLHFHAQPARHRDARSQ